MPKPSRYAQIIEDIFLANYKGGESSVSFSREEIEKSASRLNLPLVKNIGDLIYTFRFRRDLPDAILERAHCGKLWVIALKGDAEYAFELRTFVHIHPDPALPVVKVPDATPGIVSRYALSDEQALLAKLRYNRLLDIFTGVACYSIQNHLRTKLERMGQIETDEIYVGIDKRGAHYVIPVQAKGKGDRLGIVQIEQDFELCREKFPDLLARPIAAQFMDDMTIALFEFDDDPDDGVVKLAERHYRLVPEQDLSREELRIYRNRRTD
ncbi:MAG: endonuclease [Chloroflexota bacterium]|nr:endonuclease [Chloroflexota bacterium]MDE2910954.1 endonuclease [Chloroflexota bacterium]